MTGSTIMGSHFQQCDLAVTAGESSNSLSIYDWLLVYFFRLQICQCLYMES